MSVACKLEHASVTGLQIRDVKRLTTTDGEMVLPVDKENDVHGIATQ